MCIYLKVLHFSPSITNLHPKEGNMRDLYVL